MPTVDENTVAASQQSRSTKSVEILRTEQQMRALQSEWEDFLKNGAGDHTVSEHPFFMMKCLAHKKEGRTPFVVILRDDRIRCIAPFYRHRGKIPLSFGPIEIPTPDVTMLSLMGERLIHRSGSSVAENVARLLDAVRSWTREFDAIWLPEMEVPGDFWDFFHQSDRARNGFRLIRLKPHLEAIHLIDLPPSFDEYMGGFRGEDRRNRMRALRKLERAGNVTIDMFSGPDGMREFLSLADTVRNKSWKAEAFGTDRFMDPDFMDFQVTLAERGWARGYILKIDGRPVAYLLGCMYQRTFHADEWGYDAETRSLSPGVGLIIKVLRHFCEDHGGCRVLLQLGESRMKRSLGNVTYNVSHSVIVDDRALLNRMRFGAYRVVARQHQRLASLVKKVRGRV